MCRTPTWTKLKQPTLLITVVKGFSTGVIQISLTTADVFLAIVVKNFFNSAVRLSLTTVKYSSAVVQVLLAAVKYNQKELLKSVVKAFRF